MNKQSVISERFQPEFCSDPVGRMNSNWSIAQRLVSNWNNGFEVSWIFDGPMEFAHFMAEVQRVNDEMEIRLNNGEWEAEVANPSSGSIRVFVVEVK